MKPFLTPTHVNDDRHFAVFATKKCKIHSITLLKILIAHLCETLHDGRTNKLFFDLDTILLLWNKDTKFVYRFPTNSQTSVEKRGIHSHRKNISSNLVTTLILRIFRENILHYRLLRDKRKKCHLNSKSAKISFSAA